MGITHKGLSISPITPSRVGGGLPGFPDAGGAQGPGSLRRWTGLDTTGRQSRESTRLLDLLSALDQLMVPVDDQIAIIYELKKTGALHAEILSE